MSNFVVSSLAQTTSADMAQKIETQVGEDYITPSFQKHLEEFYNQANPSDQARCIELSTNVRLGDQFKSESNTVPAYTSKIPKGIRRCKSAMAKIGDLDKINKTFQTTYGKEYTMKLGPPTQADRPATSRGYATTRDMSGPIGLSNYTDEFRDKTNRPTSPIRSGSASGERNNKPHPKQAFMVWRYPSYGRKKYVEPMPVSETLTNEKIDLINKRLFTSTYQRDYLGIPQGYQMKSAFDLPPDWKSYVPFTVNTNHRIAYQNPVQQPELSLPCSRYGANTKKNLPSVGSIPAINRYLLDLKTKTTYDRHFNGNASAVTQQIRDLARSFNIETLKKYYNTSTGEEREIVGKMIHSLQPRPPSKQSQRIGGIRRTPPSRGGYTSQETPQYSHLSEGQFSPKPPTLIHN